MLVERYGLRCPRDIDLEALAIDRGVHLRIGGLTGCEARLTRIGPRGIIRVRAEIAGSQRARFAVAHELGHWEMHTDGSLFVCTESNLRDYQKDPREREANVFASELLMPARLLLPFIRTLPIGLSTFESVSRSFDVSLTAAAIRVCLEKPDEAYLVCSRAGRVEWASKFSDRSGIWIERGAVLDARTNAHHLCKNPEPKAVVEEVSADAWFPEWRGTEIEVVEESKCLRTAGVVLSLLVISDAE